MGKYSDILLTVDFDRTLTAADSTIPPRNLEAIEYFMAEGGAFTVCTGRSVPMYSGLMDVIPVNAPLILYNGSATYDLNKREFLFTTAIDLDWRQVMERCMELLPDLVVELQSTDRHYVFRPEEMWKNFCIRNRCPWGYAQLSDDLGPFLKFSVYGQFHDDTVAQLYGGTPEELARMDEAMDILHREFGDKTQIFRAADRILDIHAPGIGKGIACRRLLEELGRKILVCAGDGENDVGMMEAADYAYAPSDAIIAARYETVCPCGEGAVADVIYKKIEEIINRT